MRPPTPLSRRPWRAPLPRSTIAFGSWARVGSALLAAAASLGLRTISEAFADRVYEADGHLRARSRPGAVHAEPAVAAAQAIGIVRDGHVVASDGSRLPVEADTLCIHGDTPERAGDRPRDP